MNNTIVKKNTIVNYNTKVMLNTIVTHNTIVLYITINVLSSSLNVARTWRRTWWQNWGLNAMHLSIIVAKVDISNIFLLPFLLSLFLNLFRLFLRLNQCTSLPVDSFLRWPFHVSTMRHCTLSTSSESCGCCHGNMHIVRYFQRNKENGKENGLGVAGAVPALAPQWEAPLRTPELLLRAP
jgi:hypothetical protein